MIDRLDPLEACGGITDSYKRYLKTLLAPRDPDLAAAFDRAVDDSDLLTKGPLLEATPPYAPGASLADLVADGTLHRDFRSLHSDALPMERSLYKHQETAIRKVTGGRNLVVSTGTGSGKTESFLVPILNALIEERANGTLGPGVRALLLYPMNALANDQLKRLRGLLSVAPDITFGRYTGETKEEQRDAESIFAATSHGQRRLPNELLSREEMRANPPHILLTNYAMLEYLLLRPQDLDLFDGKHSGTWRFIALDEAHVYDGAQGAEVALLLRRLRQRVGGARPLQCIATSASLTGRTPETQGAEATTFAQNLFDAEFEYIEDDPNRQDLVTPTRQRRKELPTWSLDERALQSMAEVDADLGPIVAESGLPDASEALQVERHMSDLQAKLSRGPVSVNQLADELWPDSDDAARNLESLVTIGSKVLDSRENPALSARYHMFVRATEGAYVSFGDSGPNVLLSRHEVDPDSGRAMFEFGTCQRCGAVHLAGKPEAINGAEYFRPAKDESAVRWLVLTDTAGNGVIDEDEETLADETSKAGDTSLRALCAGCGRFTKDACTGADCPGGPVLQVREHTGKTRVMSTCTECGARSKQVIRRLRTDVNAAPAVITTALYQYLPPAQDETVEEVGEGRKLLMFSDSRQAAAFAAPYLDKTYGRMLHRRFLTMVLNDPKYNDEVLSAEDLADCVAKVARKADYFPEEATKVTERRTVNPWVMAELMALDQRQSLEGLGLMAVRLFVPKKSELPRAFAEAGLDDREAWRLLNELVKTVRLQGGMTLLDEVDIKAELFEPRNTRIRIRSLDSDAKKRIISWSPGGRRGTVNNRILLVRKVLAAVGGDPASADKLLDGCWRFLEDEGYFTCIPDKIVGDVYQVDHTRLRLVAGDMCEWYQCTLCRRLTINNVRSVCPHGSCDGELKPFDVPSVEDDTNHYRTMYRTLSPLPMAAKEHTAQWESRAAAEIQQSFIDGKVNVLSCSTTFELGVDVGDLQSVVLRNMPPKTANYVQRAGRAGRRAASAALVLTYAKRSSHDLSKYQNPESMIAGEMRIPWVPIENERIARRHAHSVALSAYFRHCLVNNKVIWRNSGPFFTPADDGSDSAASQIGYFLDPVPAQVESAIRDVLPAGLAAEIGVDDGSWVTQLRDLVGKAEEEIRADIDTYGKMIEDAIEKKKLGEGDRLQRTLRTIESRQLLGYLANKNILPKYGFPVDTVELRTFHCDSAVGASLSLQRDLSQAIYDYAPGNQVVAGGKLWTSRGLHRLPKRELVEMKYRTCRSCGLFQCGNDLDLDADCPSCHQQFTKTRTMVVPEFGFVAASKVEDVKPDPPQRIWGGDTFVETLGDISEPVEWASEGGVAITARSGTRARMAVISEGLGGGFRYCTRCGWADPVGDNRAGNAHKHPYTDNPCKNTALKTVSLAHRFETDIAELSFTAVSYTKESEGRWLSVLYALLEGASEALEISRDDIDGSLSWTPDGHRSIVLFDTVPAGAGAARKIVENLGKVIQFALDRVTRCDCGIETSCYGCLRAYRNDRYHEFLSRAGALSVFEDLKVRADSDAIDGPWGESLTYTSQAVVELLHKLAGMGVAKPRLGVECGEQLWPVEAEWPGFVLVEGDDDERDSGLRAGGYTVVNVATADVTRLVRELPMAEQAK
ncbi:MAG: DEAD/DEAH box helicase [Gordonia amarae]